MSIAEPQSPTAAPSARIFSIGTKLAVATVAVLAVACTLLFFELAGRERQSLVRAKDTAAGMVADLLAASLSAPLDFADTDAIDKELDDVRSNPIVLCAAAWLEGASPSPPVVRGPPGCLDGLSAGEAPSRRVHDDRIEVFRPVVGRQGVRVGRSALVFSLAPENAAFKVSRLRILALSFALATGTAVLLIVIAQSQIVSPLRRITAAAVRMGHGDRSARVEVESRDEIGVLAAAFNAMGGAVADREASLEAVTRSLRELFDHMRQSICAFGPDGRVRGAVSRQAQLFFGDADLEGRAVRELLFGSAGRDCLDARAFEEWLPLAFALPVTEWSEVEALAPKLAVLRRADGEEVPLELEFRPVARDNQVERVMLLATDVSEKRRLERVVQTKEAEHARRIAAMRRLVAGGSQVFLAFIDGARERVERCVAILGSEAGALRTNDIDEIFRQVHTVKGEARAFDLPELESEASGLEAVLDDLRGRVRQSETRLTVEEHARLRVAFEKMSAAIVRGSDVFVAASPIGRAALDQMTVQRSDLAELLALTKGRGDAVGKVAARLSARPFGESTASLVDSAPAWAEQEGKQLRVVVDGRELGVPPPLARVLGGVLTHLARNSVAHGIEPPEERENAGKPAAGTLRIVASEGPGGPIVAVEDDGRGLDLPRIEARAVELGLAIPVGGPADLVFESGMTTLPTGSALAGRGVGLSAVRTDLETAGYSIHLESAPGRFTRFTMSPRA